MKKAITKKMMERFRQKLLNEERCDGTVEKYLRDIRAFFAWLGNCEIDKEAAAGWKEYLQSQNYQPTTINSMLSALNGFFRFIGREDCRVRFLCIQRIGAYPHSVWKSCQHRAARGYFFCFTSLTLSDSSTANCSIK